MPNGKARALHSRASVSAFQTHLGVTPTMSSNSSLLCDKDDMSPHCWLSKQYSLTHISSAVDRETEARDEAFLG